MHYIPNLLKSCNGLYVEQNEIQSIVHADFACNCSFENM